MLSVFLFHTARFFDFNGWHVKNAVESTGADVFIWLFAQWVMPLFFVIAGASVFFALRRRTARQFTAERLLRIAIPLLIIGIFVLAPPQVYLERITNGDFIGSFWQFYPHYFDGVYIGDSGGNFAFHGMHLWFLLILFLFSVIALPLLIKNARSGVSPLQRMGVWLNRPLSLLLLALPIAVVEGLLPPDGIGFRDMGGCPVFTYLLLFLYGYMIYSNPNAQTAVKRVGPMALAVAVALTIVGSVTRYMMEIEIEVGSLQYFGMGLFRAVQTWCWVLAILSYGARFLNRDHKSLAYANEAVLPFYLLHQTVLLLIGYFIVQWDMGVAAKYAIIGLCSFIAIMGIYELVIKRNNVLRFLAGMKPKAQNPGSLTRTEKHPRTEMTA
jgi:hypothetical protein